MGRKIVLTGTKLTDLAAPKLAAIDTILPDAGALLFLDPAHPYQPWGNVSLTAANSTDGQVPNLAFAQAKAMVPAGTAASLGAYVQKGAGLANDGVSSKVERTGKGGLHVVFSQTTGNATSGERHLTMFTGADIGSYIMANKAHSFYAAFWGRLTRSSIQFDAGAYSHSMLNSQNNMAAFYTRPNAAGETQYPTDAKRIGHMGENTLGTAGKTNLPIFQDVAMSDATAITNIIGRPFVMVSPNSLPNAYRMPSMAFYGYYLEDLTVSGRTYAQVNALVKAKYDKDVKTAGGRYYADTFTDPATMP
jgi:hypothetical protein